MIITLLNLVFNVSLQTLNPELKENRIIKDMLTKKLMKSRWNKILKQTIKELKCKKNIE